MKWVFFFFPSIIVPFVLGDIYKHAISFMGQLNFREKKRLKRHVSHFTYDRYKNFILKIED